MGLMKLFFRLFPYEETDLQKSGVAFELIRQTPKGTLVEQRTDEAVVLRFKAVVRFWWVLPYMLFAITIFVVLPLGFVFRDQFWIFVFVALFAISVWLTRPWVKLVATPDYIKVGSRYYDRTMYGGMRLGYEIQGAGDVLKNDFHDLSLGMQALRLSYGPWGEDLPYLVNRYHATAIVIWLNYMIAGTARKPAEPTDLAAGQRQQSF